MSVFAALFLACCPVQEGAAPIPPEVAAYVAAVRKAADRLSKGDLDAAAAALDGADLAQRGFEWDHLALSLALARENAARPLARDDLGRGARGAGRGESADDALAALADPETRAVSTLRGHMGDLRAAAISPDGDRIATPGMEDDVRIWNARTGDVLLMLTGHDGPVSGLSFSPDGRRVASSSLDGTVRLWEAFDGRTALVLHGTGAALDVLAFSRDGARLATADATSVVRIWSADRSEALVALHGHGAAITTLAFSPDRRRLASGSVDGSVRVWDVDGGEPLVVFTPGPGPTPPPPDATSPAVTAVAFEPDGGTLLVAAADGYLHRRSAADGSSLTKLRTYGGKLRALAVALDGKRFVTGAEHGRVQIWHPVGVPLYQLQLGDADVRTIAFDAHARRLCVATADRVVHVLETDATTARAVQRGTLDELPDVEAAAALKPLVVDALCRRVVHRAGLAVERYEQAETLLAGAVERMPESGAVQTTLGAARYRQERYEEALTTLTEAGDRRRGFPANLAYRAMTLARLGRKDEARTQLDRLDTLMREARWKDDVEAGVLRDEAHMVVRAVIDPKR